jgi:hypothetical protein
VGYNPFRKHSRSNAEIAAMVLCGLAAVALIVWALIPN